MQPLNPCSMRQTTLRATLHGNFHVDVGFYWHMPMKCVAFAAILRHSYHLPHVRPTTHWNPAQQPVLHVAKLTYKYKPRRISFPRDEI